MDNNGSGAMHNGHFVRHAGSNSDPSLHTCSPLAQFSSLALQEHAEAVAKLNAQRAAILRAQQVLEERDAAEQRRVQHNTALLAREEGEALHALALNARTLEELASALEAAVRETDAARRLGDANVGSAEEELAELQALSGDLAATVQGLEAQATRVAAQRRVFADASNRSMTSLEGIRRESQQAATLLHRFGPGRTVADQIVTATNTSATSPPRRGYDAPPAFSPGGGGLQRDYYAGAPQPSSYAALSALRDASGAAALQDRANEYAANAAAATTSYFAARAGTPPRQRSLSPYGALPSAGRAPNAGPYAGRPIVSPKQHGHALAHAGQAAPPVSSATIVFPARTGGGTGGVASPGTSKLPAEVQQMSREAAHNASGLGFPAIVHRASSPAGRATVVAHHGSDGPPHLAATLRPAASQSALHVACAAGTNGTDAVLDILRGSAAAVAVNALDDAGNTPLHVACAAHAPSLEVAHALLLAGAVTTVKNNDGLTPFHLACLNTADQGHKLKKFLVFKGSQNPNQRTARGETAAHLLAAHDRNLDALRYLVTVGADTAAEALMPSGGLDAARSPTRGAAPGGAGRLTPLQVAIAAGACAAKCRAFLSGLPQ